MKTIRKKRPQGTSWDTIHENLEMMARRIVSYKCPLEHIKIVYDCMNLAKEWENKTSTNGIASKLEEQAKKRKSQLMDDE